MVNFVALYRGESLQKARLVAVTTDPELVAQIAAALLSNPPAKVEDPVLAAMHEGRRRALRLMRRETAQAGTPGAPDGAQM